MIDGGMVYVLLVVFVATFIRSIFGFGEALVAVPLLALRLPLKTAAPLAVLLSVVVALIIVLQDWHHVEFRSAGWLLVSSVLGIPVGVLLLARANHRVLTAGLGIIILLFAIHALTRRRGPELRSDNIPW